MPIEAFPETQRTRIRHWLDQGEAGIRDLNHHLMLVYAPALRIYFLGTSYRRLGEPDEIINGFLADRLDRPDFMLKWRDSGLRLRRWLANGLCFYLKEEWRKRKRFSAEGTIGEEPPAAPQDSDRSIDRAFVQASVRAALQRAQSDCEKRNLSTHWSMFMRYHFEGVPCKRLAEEFGVSSGQAWVMVRTAQRRFTQSLRDVISEDSDNPSRVDEEIAALLDAAG